MAGEFPTDGLVPTKSTGAATFLEQNPEWDGRGVLVAVLDTGVDPGAAGLSRTPLGEPKVVGLLDTSGGGDVDTSTVVKGKAAEDGSVLLQGLSKRELKLPAGLDNPSGEWRVGIKPAFEIFPRKLADRMRTHRAKAWRADHAAALVAAQEPLRAFDEANKVTGKKPALSRPKLLERNELKARVELLEAAEKERQDAGDVCDCVVWQGADGIWRCLVDKDGSGDLRTRAVLRSYGARDASGAVTCDFDKWDDVSQLNYAVNVFHDGALLSIVVDSGAHGTHVASIAAGYHPDRPELNGVAPGAQVVSMKIGDGRLDGMETGPAIIRALNACACLGVDIINMSFGEATRLPDVGRIAELARELVERHGVIFVSSAGNAGPALSTVGAPGSTSDALIGVGAYVEPAMMLAAYGMREGHTPPPINYTWTSRGPSYDGGAGVCIAAPGGAICSVPEWTLMQSRLMNGTSMASPNAAGCVALIVSGLKALGVEYAPWTIKRALMASAALVPGVEEQAQGAGLVQVGKAFELLRSGPRGMHTKVAYEIAVVSSECRTNHRPAAGIYIREPWETYPASTREFIVNVTPRFPKRQANMRPELRDTIAKRLNFEEKDHNELMVKVHLRCTQPWIVAPSFLVLNAGPKSFRVGVDLSAVPTSASGDHMVPSGRVEAFDPDEPTAQGPLWSVPVTVVRPELCELGAGADDDGVEPAASVARLRQPYAPIKHYANVPFRPGHIVRHFVVVPPGATWMDLSLSPAPGGRCTVPVGSSRTFYVHCLQMRQQSSYARDELSTSVQVRAEDSVSGTRTLRVVEGGTVEVCVAQFWSSLGEGPINIDLRFNGVTPSPSSLTLSAAAGGVAEVTLRAGLGPVRVSPAAKLKTWCHAVRPTAAETKLAPMPVGERDSVLAAWPPESRPTFGLWLVYSFKQAEAGKLTPRLPMVDPFLYESPFGSQMCMLFDSNDKLLLTTDAWPKPAQVPKGDITARVLVRHEDSSALERLRDMPLVLERPLASDVALTVHKTMPGACSGSAAFSPKLLSRGETIVIALAAPRWSEAAKKLPKTIAAGDVLKGSITYGKRSGRDAAHFGTDKAPGGYPVEWHIVTAPQSAPGDPTLKEEEGDCSGGEKGVADEGKREAEEGKDKKEEDEHRVAYKALVAPSVNAKLKAMQDLVKKKGPANDRAFEALVGEVHAAIKGVDEKVIKEEDVSTELRGFSLKVLRLELERLAFQQQDALKPALGTGEPKAEAAGTEAEAEAEAATATAAKRAALAEKSDALIAAIEPEKLFLKLAKFKQGGDLDGVGESDKQKEQTKHSQELRQWLVEAAVLKLYATDFAEGEASELLAQFAEAKDLAVVLLRVHRHWAQGRLASALQLVEKKLLSEPKSALEGLPLPTNTAELNKSRVALLRALSWTHMAEELAESRLRVDFPATRPCF